MAGIYIHIPFCKQACHYCNFHFSTSLKMKSRMVAALQKELVLRRDYLGGTPIQSVYLGGGTPSLLTAGDLDRLFATITGQYEVLPDAEITLEANPDDLSDKKINALRASPVNRLSIGIQSFFDEDLVWMNRAHNAGEAATCIHRVREAGFENLTIDLIYGAPVTSDANWRSNLQRAIAMQIPHLSCYCLTVEPKTALAHFVKTGKSQPVDDEQAARQFEILMDMTAQAGYEHYEISNFARPGWYSKHNASYWLDKKYLGVGPSAHSFNHHSRQWNVANNARYLRALEDGILNFEMEILSPAQRYNEYVMTALRTRWGCAVDQIKHIDADYVRHFKNNIQPYIADGSVIQDKGIYRLTQSGKLLADRIAMEVFAD